MARSVEGYTTRDMIVVQWTSLLEEAQRLMVQNRVRHLPVVNDRGTIVGIISERDLSRARRSDRFDPQAPFDSADFDPTARVADHMSWPVEAVAEDSSLAAAARKMIDEKISSLLVTHGSQAVGIVTTEDLLEALLDESEGPLTKITGEVRAAIYDTRIGQVIQALANAGI